MAFTIGGITAVRPQAIAVVDDSQLVASNNINDVVLAVIGAAKSGPVNTPVLFTNASDAGDVYIEGELLDALRRAYSPGIVPGAYRVYGVRLDGDPLIDANLGAAGVLTLLDANDDDAIDLTGVRVGALDNLTAVQIAANGGGGYDITVYHDTGSFTGRRIGAKGISVRYTGSNSTATLTITGSALTTTITGLTGDQVNLDFATYATLQRLVDAINATGKYTALVTGLNPAAASTTLDGATTVNIKASAIQFRCDLAAQIAWFNSAAANYVSAARSSGALLPAAVVGRTYLAGGDDPVITTNSWAPALAALEAVNVNIVAPVSGDGAVHALVTAHCEAMSDPRTKHERRAIVGGVAGETVDQACARALALNSQYAQLVYPGLKDIDEFGNLVVIPPYMVAVQKAGISAGLQRGHAATYKFLKAAGIEFNLSQSGLDLLEESGVMGIEFVTGRGFRIVHDQTTYLKTAHIDRREFSTALVVDQIVARLRTIAELRIGEPATPASKNVIEGDIAAECGRMTQEELLVGSPAYRNLSVSVVGTQVTVRIEVAVALPMNFVGIIIVPTSATGLA